MERQVLGELIGTALLVVVKSNGLILVHAAAPVNEGSFMLWSVDGRALPVYMRRLHWSLACLSRIPWHL